MKKIIDKQVHTEKPGESLERSQVTLALPETI